MLLNLPLLEPLLTEGDAYAEPEVVLRERAFLHGGYVEVGDVGVCPLHSKVESWTHAPSLGEGDGETCRNAELVGLVRDGA